MDGTPAAHVASAARKVQRSAVRLSTRALDRMEATLPWFAAMPADQRSWVGLLVQHGLVGLADWLRHPENAPRITMDVFGSAPREMARLVSLEQTVELMRVAIEVAEEAVAEIAAPGEEPALREATLRFSRELAFAAAMVYARAAEQRGAWDARLEALVVDAVVRGEADDALLSRAAALGWSQPEVVTVVVGTAPPGDPEPVLEDVHHRAQVAAADVLAGVQGSRLVTILGASAKIDRAVRGVLPSYAEGPVVVGPVVDSLAAARASAQAAFAAARAVAAWPSAPRPVAADDLLPERALDGDATARRMLVEDVYRPLVEAGNLLAETLDGYLAAGASYEAAARDLFVHANTVRYRLGRVADICGCNPAEARDRYVLQVALSLGRLAAAPRGL